MTAASASPDIDRRELLESLALRGLASAVTAVERDLDRLLPDADVAGRRHVPALIAALLRATLSTLVQGSLSVSERERLGGTWDALADPLLRCDILRTVRLVGVEALAAELTREADLTRDEYLHLRAGAERVAGLLDHSEEVQPPTGSQVLQRLNATGVDVR